MGTIVERLKQYIDTNGISVSTFEKNVGMSNGAFGKTLKNGGSIGTDKLENILYAYPDIPREWLLMGGEYRPAPVDVPKANYKTGVPYYNVDFTCGFDLVENNQTTKPDCLIDFSVYNKADCWCNATGDSMYPEIKSGDIIALKELHGWRTYIPYGEIYGVVTDENRTIKRVCASKKDGFVTLVPTNVDGGYTAQEIPINVIRRVYRVMGAVRRF